MAKRERSLSDFWREDRSDDRVMELTSVLMGADSLLGVMGSGVSASWSGNGESFTYWMRMRAGDPLTTKVYLDYSPLIGLKAPFPGRAVDEVIGYGAHEGGHCLWSDPDGFVHMKTIIDNSPSATVQKALRDTPHNSTSMDCRCPICRALRVDNIIEDAYIDYHVSEVWPVLGEYIRYARQQIHARRPIDFGVIGKKADPTRREITNLWIGCSLYALPLPDKMSKKVRDAMNTLLAHSMSAVQASDSASRLKISRDAFTFLEERFKDDDSDLPRMQPPPQGGGQGEQGEGNDQTGQGQQGGQQGQQGQDQGQQSGGQQGGQPGEQKDQQGGSGGGDGKEDPADKGEDKDGKGAGKGEDSKPEQQQPGQGQQNGQQNGQQPGQGQKQDKSTGKQSGKPQDGGKKGGSEQGAPSDLDDFDMKRTGEVPKHILEQIADAISHEIEDLTASVAEVMNHTVRDVVTSTKKADYDGPAKEKIEQQVEAEIAKMRKVFDRQQDVKTRYIHGQQSGRLDGRRLSRVGCGNFRVYQRKEVLEQPDMAIGFLGDASGSMGSHMASVYGAACVFSEALIRKPGINFMALAYTGGYDNVQTTRLCDKAMPKLCLGNVQKGGGTPSGQAIAAMKVLMDRMPERHKVIIHFTDGAPDNAIAVQKAVEACRDDGYAVWAVGLHGMERQLAQQYGDGNWETMDSVHDLPTKIGDLVRRLVFKK